MNKAQIIGNCGKDPEIRYLQSGDALASFSLATSRKWKDKQTGEQREETEWHNCSCFGKLAEVIGKYVKKGSKIYVEGRLKTESYDKDGQKHYSTKIIVEEMEMLDKKPDGDNQTYQPAGAYQSAPTQVYQPPQHPYQSAPVNPPPPAKQTYTTHMTADGKPYYCLSDGTTQWDKPDDDVPF